MFDETKARYNALLSEIEAQKRESEQKIAENKKKLEDAAREMEEARKANNEPAYMAARRQISEAEALIDMHTDRLRDLNSTMQISDEEYNEIIVSIYSAAKSRHDEIARDVLKHLQAIYELSAQAETIVNAANALEDQVWSRLHYNQYIHPQKFRVLMVTTLKNFSKSKIESINKYLEGGAEALV